MIIERLNRPTAAVVDLAEAKNHARVDGDFEDGDFIRMIDAVAGETEDYASIALLEQQIRVILPSWPESLSFSLPILPLLNRDSVTITAGTETIDDFSVMTGRRPAVRLTGTRPVGVVLIDYTAGFGDQPADIPADLRHALLDQIAAYYDARGAVDSKTVTMSPHFARIVGRYRGVRA